MGITIQDTTSGYLLSTANGMRSAKARRRYSNRLCLHGEERCLATILLSADFRSPLDPSSSKPHGEWSGSSRRRLLEISVSQQTRLNRFSLSVCSNKVSP